MNRRKILLGCVSASAGLISCGDQQAVVDHIIVRKTARTMTLYKGKTKIADFDIHLGFSPRGHKVREGDGKTPEGRYYIKSKNPNSAFHLSLEISYPDVDDVARARALGVRPGGDIFIHGGPNRAENKFKKDWTAGCIAVTDKEIEQVYRLTKVGAIIDIRK